MLLKAINKALAGDMNLPKVKEVLRKCGYDLTVTTEVDETTLEIMFEVPDDEHDDYHAGDPRCEFPLDGAEVFDMIERGVGIYHRATIRKLWNPNFVSAMALLGSPLPRGGHHA